MGYITKCSVDAGIEATDLLNIGCILYTDNTNVVYLWQSVTQSTFNGQTFRDIGGSGNRQVFSCQLGVLWGLDVVLQVVALCGYSLTPRMVGSIYDMMHNTIHSLYFTYVGRHDGKEELKQAERL